MIEKKKKLQLNRETIRDLEDSELMKVAGGLPPSGMPEISYLSKLTLLGNMFKIGRFQ